MDSREFTRHSKRDVRIDPEAAPALRLRQIRYRMRQALERLTMFQFAGETQSCLGFETLIRLAREVDPETAALYEAELLPDEYPARRYRTAGAPPPR